MSENSIAFRLKVFIDSLGVPNSVFADNCGIPRPSFSQLLSGRNKKVSDLIISQIHEAYPQLSIMWLLFGEGDMLKLDGDGENAGETPVGSDSRTVDVHASEAASLFSGSDSQISDGCGSIFPHNESNLQIHPALTPLSQGVNVSQKIVNELNELKVQLRQKEEQIATMTKNPRKVAKITIYYDDSTFETFVPEK